MTTIHRIYNNTNNNQKTQSTQVTTPASNDIDPAAKKILDDMNKIKDSLEALIKSGASNEKIQELLQELANLAKDMEGITGTLDRDGLIKDLEDLKSLIHNTLEKYRLQIGEDLTNILEYQTAYLITQAETKVQGLTPEQQKEMNAILEDLNKIFSEIKGIFQKIAEYDNHKTHSVLDKIKLAFDISAYACKIIAEAIDIAIAAQNVNKKSA